MEITLSIPEWFITSVVLIGKILLSIELGLLAGWLLNKGIIKPLKNKLSARREARWLAEMEAQREEDRRWEEARLEEDRRLCDTEEHILSDHPYSHAYGRYGEEVTLYRCNRCGTSVEDDHAEELMLLRESLFVTYG